MTPTPPREKTYVWIVETGDYEQRGIWSVAESVEAAVQSIKDSHEGYTVRWDDVVGGADACQIIGHFAGDPGKAIKHDAYFDISRHEVVVAHPGLNGKKLRIRVTDEMVKRAAEAAWQAWPGDDPSWAALQSVIRPALEAALGEEEDDD